MTPLYSMASCPQCGDRCAQRQESRYRVQHNGDRVWMEQRTCTSCGQTYAVECLPYLAQALDVARPLQPRLI